ncbi:MAG: amidohydrolase [Cyclobacteriaceae bacterium]|nr:amidohydrolase [Cyclobacteriaceae bacterium]
MKDSLTLKLIQTDLYWESKDANLGMLEEKIWQVEGDCDVIVLPEMFTTGFTMNAPPHSELMNMKTMKWMKQMALQTGALMLGSFIVRENSHYYNRLLWVEPDGQVLIYDKKHLFSMAGEHEIFSPGQQLLVAEWKGWKICPLICYDLRFPVWSRNRLNGDELLYDVLIYVANWPAARIQAWDILLKARAIENLCYTVAVNRTGTDENGILYNGHSAAIDPKGNLLGPVSETPEIISVILQKDELLRYRQKFPAHRDADDFFLKGS